MVKIVDTVCAFVLVLCILSGCYRGFIDTVIGFFLSVISLILGRIFMPVMANAVKGSETLYNMLLYYTEGSEYVAATSVELTRMSIRNVTAAELKTIIANADMPLPLGDRTLRNIAVEAFSDTGYTALGDYFNLTIVSVVINVFSLLFFFILFRILLGVLLRAIGYGRGGFPMLSQFDTAAGAGVGFLHGVLILFVLFLLLPVALTVLPKIRVFIKRSFFGEFFYRANFLYLLIPGT